MNKKHPFSSEAGHPQGQDQGECGEGCNCTNRQSAKGRAAYAVHDNDLPLFTPGGFGPTAGLFADDVAAPAGHGVHAQQEANPLVAVSKEDLFAAAQERICPDCPVKKDADEQRLRALAELDNGRKRLAREKDDQIRFAAGNILSDIVPSLDNLDLALQHAATDDVCKNFVIGVQMTRKLMLDALQKHGLELVGAVGEEFSPALHEAVGMADSTEVPEGAVCELLSSGYRLKDRLLRPARVLVCKKA